MNSKKTTAAGVLAALSALFQALSAQFDSDPTTIPQWGVAVTAIMFAVGLIFARDNDVSSESAGAK